MGEGSEVHTRTLDIAWRTPQEVHAPTWLGSELANHIAEYGCWLHGTPTWTHGVYIDEHTIHAKRAAILARLGASLMAWDNLQGSTQDFYRLKLRHDLQRLRIMETGHPVPPRPQLDQAWARSGDVDQLCRGLGGDDLTAILAGLDPPGRCRIGEPINQRALWARLAASIA